MNTSFLNEEYVLNLNKMSKSELIHHLRQKGLLPFSINCSFCDVSMNEHACKRVVDGRIFKCKNKVCIKKTTTASIRTNSFFMHFKLPLITLVNVIYLLSLNEGKTKIALRKNLHKETILHVQKQLIIRMSEFFALNPIKLGGPGIICQCDETLLSGKRKYNVGSIVSLQTWVFVIVDTSYIPARGFACVVDNRRTSTLLPIINNVCLPGTTIHSDQWPAYRQICDNFVHYTVNHKINFVDPTTGVHTQNVESYNNRLKMPIKAMKGIKKSSIDSYLIEFMWKERNSDNLFISLLNLIKH